MTDGNQTTKKPAPPEVWWQSYEDAGYAAGIAGHDVNQAKGWADAWKCPGQNLPMYILAGWVAGRAMLLIKNRIGEAATTSPPLHSERRI